MKKALRMKNTNLYVLTYTFLLLLITACNSEPAKPTCHITTGGQEYHYPEFTKEECKKEVNSLIDKGIIDARSDWKISSN